MSPSQTTIKSWFDARYAEKGLDSMRSPQAYSIYLDYLEVEAGKKLLDVGCGTGFLLAEAAERGLETYGIDLSEEAVKLSRTISPGSVLQVGNGENLDLPDGYFDYITCIGTLEHFLNMDRGLGEMRRVASGKATFCFLVPNARSVLWKILSTFNLIEENSNENALSLAEWTELFLANGLRPIDIHRDRWYLRKLSFVLGIGSSPVLQRVFCKDIPSFVPLNNGNQFVFLLKRS